MAMELAPMEASNWADCWPSRCPWANRGSRLLVSRRPPCLLRFAVCATPAPQGEVSKVSPMPRSCSVANSE